MGTSASTNQPTAARQSTPALHSKTPLPTKTQQRAVSPTSSSSQIAEDVAATYLKYGSHDVSPTVSRPLTAESLADLKKFGSTDGRGWGFGSVSPQRSTTVSPDPAPPLDQQTSPSAKLAAALTATRASAAMRLRNAKQIASFVASHGYNIVDDDRIRVGAHLITQLSAPDAAVDQKDAVTNPDTRDAVLAMAKNATANETIVWVANAIGNLVKDASRDEQGPASRPATRGDQGSRPSTVDQFPMPRGANPQQDDIEPSFEDVEDESALVSGMEPMRDALLHLAKRSSNAHAFLCIARAMHRIVASHKTSGQRVFGTVRVRRALIYMASRSNLPSETSRWIARCISAITVGNTSNQLMFGIAGMRDVLMPLVMVATSTEAVEAIAEAFAALLVPSQRQKERSRRTLQVVVEVFTLEEVRHTLMVLSGFRPTSPLIISSVASALHEMCGWGPGAALLSHKDALRTYTTLLRQCSDAPTAEVVLKSIARLGSASPHLTPAFADASFRDALIRVGESCCSATDTPAALLAWCCAMQSLASWDALAQLFAVTPMRQAFIHIGKAISNAELTHWWCAALVSVSVRAHNKSVFGSTSSRIILCQLGRRTATTPEAVMWVGYAIYSLAMDRRCCNLFRHPHMRVAFVEMAPYATTPDAVASLCTALAHITSVSNTIEMDPDTLEAPAEGTLHRARSSSSFRRQSSSSRERIGDAFGMQVDVDELGHIDSVTLNEHNESIFSTHDVRDAFVTMANFCTSSDAASCWCSAMTNLVNNESTRMLFGCPTVRDAIHGIGRYVVTSDAAHAWCALVAQLAASQENRSLFRAASFRHALYTIAIHCTTDTAVMSFGWALANIAMDIENKTFYGTTKALDMITRTSEYINSPDASRRWSSALRMLAMNDENRKLLGTQGLLSALIRVSQYCTLAESVHEWCAAVKALCINAENKRLFGESSFLRDAFVRLAKHSWSADAVRSLCGALSCIAMDARGRQALTSYAPLANAVALLDAHASSALARDAHATAVKLFRASSLEL